MKKYILITGLLSLLLIKPVFALTLVQAENGKYGYQNTAGEWIISPNYISAEPFNEDGMALVSQDVAGDGWPYDHGYIDETGKEVIPLRYQYLSQFVEGFAVAQRNGKFGYITPSGSVAVDFIYSEAAVFIDGKAVVTLNNEVMVIGRPNWEESTLNIRETDYVAFTTTAEFVTYFEEAVSAFDGNNTSESDFIVLEKYFAALLGKMMPLEAQVDGNTVMILSENYADILAASKSIYAALTSALEAANIPTTESMESYLRLIYNGVANVQYNGQVIDISSDINYQVVAFPVPYFDKSIYSGFQQNSDFNAYLSERLAAMAGQSPNLSGAEGLVDYINYSFVNLEPLHVSSFMNKITIGTSKQEDFFKEISEFNTQIHNTLSQYELTLQENVTNTMVILVDGNDLSKEIKFKFDSEFLLPYLAGMDGLRIIVGNQGQGVYLPADELSLILSSQSSLEFTVLYGDNGCVLQFYASDGKTETREIQAPIFLILPAATTTTSVYALLADQPTQNWGGMVKLNNTIEFSTTYSGEYVTREARSVISDIGELSFDTQEKIHFMVSKGFFALEGDLFHPDAPMTRSELVSALVKLFFAQDNEATSSFSDLSPDDPNYALISAAYQAGIVDGYDDNTFGGDNFATRYEVISFLARTLVGSKGFTLTQDPTETVQVFSDYSTIPEWGLENVALAIEHNLIDNFGTLDGGSEVSRREVAVLLNTLFYELYDSPDAVTGTLDYYKVTEGKSLPILPLAAGIFAILCTGIGVRLHRKSQAQKHIMERMKIVTEALTKDLEEGRDFDEYI